MTTMATVDVRPYEPEDAAGIARLSTTVQWPSLTDPEVVHQVCTAPGAVAYVAAEGGPDHPAVVGWAKAVGDGVLQAHLDFLAVHPDRRHRGIGRLLLTAVFQATGTKRIDLVTEGAEGFYERFGHRRMSGFRLYPGA